MDGGDGNPADHVVLFMAAEQSYANHSSESQQNHRTETPINPSQPPPRLQKLHRLNFSKPKTRLADFSHYPPTQKPPFDDGDGDGDYSERFNPTQNDTDSDEYEEEPESGEFGDRMLFKKKRKIPWRAVVEWGLFLIIMTCLISSLTISSLKHSFRLGLELWKWCLLVLVIFSGRLVSGWVVRFMVFLIERNFMLREKVMYFVYGLRKSFQNCVWLGLVLLAWTFMFNWQVHKENKMVKKVFQALVAVLVGATVWLIKIVLVKVLASSFHVTTYFDRMKESVFHHYVLETLSGPPMDTVAYEKVHGLQHLRNMAQTKSMPAKLGESSPLSGSGRVHSRRIDMEKLKKLTMESNKSAWSVKRLANYVRSFGLSTLISRKVDEFGEYEITSEWEARMCAKRIFKNVAKPGAKYIEEEDLMRFLKKVEIHTIFPLFEGALETGWITKSAFRNWVVRAYYERKFLAHSLNDTKTAVQQLHKLMIVEEMNILTTVFLRYDNEKIYYPNAVLITKPISNFYRSPEMSDTINFDIDINTPMETIIALKKAIQTYIESKPKYWNPKHSVVVKGLDNVSVLKMFLSVQHTINHQNYGDRNNRITELVLELKRIFESLSIKYSLLPQEVHLTQFNTPNCTMPIPHP